MKRVCFALIVSALFLGYGSPRPQERRERAPSRVQDHCDLRCKIPLHGSPRGINGISQVRWSVPEEVTRGQRLSCTVEWLLEHDTDFTPNVGRYNPNAVIQVNVFGDWQPQQELARLIDSELQGNPRRVQRTFHFRAPEQPGLYTVRWMYITWYHPIVSFYGGRNNPKDNCSPVAWSEKSFRVTGTAQPRKEGRGSHKHQIR